MVESLLNALQTEIKNLPATLEKTKSYTKRLVRVRMLKGLGSKGEQVVSPSANRYKAYSYKYGRWKEKRGFDVSRYTFFLSGLLHRKMFVNQEYNAMQLPQERDFLYTNPHIEKNTQRLTNLSQKEKDLSVHYYGSVILGKISKAF